MSPLFQLKSNNRYSDKNSVLVPKNYLAFQSSILSVLDEGYSRNGSCALNLISTFLLQKINYLATPGLKNIYYFSTS